MQTWQIWCSFLKLGWLKNGKSYCHLGFRSHSIEQRYINDLERLFHHVFGLYRVSFTTSLIPASWMYEVFHCEHPWCSSNRKHAKWQGVKQEPAVGSASQIQRGSFAWRGSSCYCRWGSWGAVKCQSFFKARILKKTYRNLVLGNLWRPQPRSPQMALIQVKDLW